MNVNQVTHAHGENRMWTYNETLFPVLQHHGINGQRWGVRRFQNPDGSLTPEGKIRYSRTKSSAKILSSVNPDITAKCVKKRKELAKKYFGFDISDDDAKPDSRIKDDKPFSLNAGQTIQHIAAVPFTGLRSGQIYVTATSRDNDLYEAFLSANLRNKGYSPRKVSLKLKEDLLAPSYSEQYSMFKQFYRDNEDSVDSDLSKYSKDKGREFAKPSTEKELFDTYVEFTNSFETKSESRDEFYSKLMEKGYNSVLDEHDRVGSWMQGEKPIIVIDQQKTIGSFNVEPVTDADMASAYQRYSGSIKHSVTIGEVKMWTYHETRYPDFLIHWRTKGSRNGVRLYQYPDGSLTPLGREHYGIGPARKGYTVIGKSSSGSGESDGGNSGNSGKWFKQNIKAGKDKAPVSPAEKTAKESQRMVDETRGIAQAVRRIKQRNAQTEDLSEISDAELKARINRLNMERQYATLTTEETGQGLETVADILAIVGGTVAIVGGVVTTVATIKNM